MEITEVLKGGKFLDQESEALPTAQQAQTHTQKGRPLFTLSFSTTLRTQGSPWRHSGAVGAVRKYASCSFLLRNDGAWIRAAGNPLLFLNSASHDVATLDPTAPPGQAVAELAVLSELSWARSEFALWGLLGPVKGWVWDAPLWAGPRLKVRDEPWSVGVGLGGSCFG